jgi:SAM-dependent methyltransferase
VTRAAAAHERRNREFWDADADDYQAAHDGQLSGRVWGVWSIPDAEIGALGDVRELTVLELGCGAAQWSIALVGDARLVIGLDQSTRQLHHAAGNVAAKRARVPLLCASGEAIPLRSASFDVVFCDHGALSFCDPDVIVPECARLLRPGGRLAFNHGTLLRDLCYDQKRDHQTKHLHRPYYGARVFDWSDGTVDFHRTYGEWIRCFRRHGLVIDDLVELVPPEGASTTYTDYVPYEWARAWPAEEIWVLHKEAT